MPFVLVLIAIAGLLVTWIGFAGLTGQLRRNYFAGIRTSYTVRNDENWNAVHHAAGPVFMFGGVLVTATALAFIPFAFADKLSMMVQVIAAGGCAGVLLGTVCAGWYAGTSFAAARDVANSRGPQR
jgi:uncharacterized membrane protein